MTAFSRIVVVDFSAAATRGPQKPHKDRCWLAWGDDGGQHGAPEYFRTRALLSARLLELVTDTGGPVLLAWDFPFGYPLASGLGGGRRIAARLAGLVRDEPDDSNNRFEVAALLNRELGQPPGPFWARPRGLAILEVPERKPDFGERPFPEWRIVEHRVRGAGHSSIQSVWKLFTTGSVGSQALMGLALIERLNRRLGPGITTRYWPFETDWNGALDGVVHAECWPTLFDHRSQPYDVKDACQVAATCDGLLAADAAGRLVAMLGPPPDLSGPELQAVSREEGWILGFPSRG
ncbi:MAG: hypothetical protein VYB54_07820 [Pseudomonadota bacterium]|nr:hypothetical protein [Pseudomonadota bacterium]